MANKRMFTMKIVDSDAFLEMPLSSQCLYFHLNMRADDDGFIGNPRKIMRIVGASEDDLKLLIAKKFLLTFENGVIVIKHWRMHNTLSKSRYHETPYIEEKGMLRIKRNNAYSLGDGEEINDTKLIESSDRQCCRTIDEQTENADLDLDLDLDLDIDKEDTTNQKKSDKIPYDEIIDYLNEKTNSSYRSTTDKTRKSIRARFKEGFTTDDFKTVIDNMTKEWIADKKMCKYLRPDTLFGTKFESYLNRVENKSVIPENFDKAWNNTYKIYPKKVEEESARTEWMKKILSVNEEERQALATDIYRAMKLFITDYEKNNEGNFKYLPKFAKWLEEDCDFWMRKLEQ